jgi:hypothetical protein
MCCTMSTISKLDVRVVLLVKYLNLCYAINLTHTQTYMHLFVIIHGYNKVNNLRDNTNLLVPSGIKLHRIPRTTRSVQIHVLENGP